MKVKLGRRYVRLWKWVFFINFVRIDGVVFYYWRRVVDEGKEYLFVRFNKVRFYW